MWYRRSIHALVATVWILQRHGILAQMCSSIKNFQHVHEDTAITGSKFLTLTGFGLVGCSKQCLLRSACQSFNYQPSTQECQLNKNSSSTTESGNVKNVVGTTSSDISNWTSKRLAGSCSSRGCPENAVCVEELQDTTCEIECPDPTLQNGSFTSPISHNVGTILTFECDATFKATGTARCQDDGTWSVFSCIQGCINPPNIMNAELATPGSEWPTGSTLEYECKGSLDTVGSVSCLSDGTWTEMKCVARTCSSLLQCNISSGDGEYWLYPEVLHDKPVKIYCHNMNTGNPVEYLTLPEDNYNDYSYACDTYGWFTDCEPTRFYKVRITKIAQLSTDGNGLRDLSFINTTSTCRRVYFAVSTDCHDRCQERKTTNFVINTKGTGLIVDADQQWTPAVPDTDLLQPVEIEKTDSGRHIVIKCHQPCSNCYPANLTLTFVLDEDQSIDITSAVLPSCF